MELFETEAFRYKNGELFCEDVPVAKLAKEFGTPLYIYSKKEFTTQYQSFRKAFDPYVKIFYASKANFNLSVIRAFVQLGAGVDVNSAGELYRALKAGAKSENIVLSGVGKTEEEIALALEKGLYFIKAESLEELDLINAVAGRLGKKAEVAIRVNPNVDAKTHPYISTALAENKFGISWTEAENVYKHAANLKNLNVSGIDMHLGSQITEKSPYVEAVTKLADLFSKLRASGLPLKHLDLGGGMGVKYSNDDSFLSPGELWSAIKNIVEPLKCEVIFEPGRALAANAGLLAAKLLYRKKNGEKNFYVTDAAMNDLLRPSIYKAYHHIQPVKLNGAKDLDADVVGPVCESGDFLGKARTIEEMKSGEYLAVMSAGAYGMVMSSNYNARRRAAEIMVEGSSYKVVRSRETFEHLLYDEQ